MRTECTVVPQHLLCNRMILDKIEKAWAEEPEEPEGHSETDSESE